MERTVGIDPNLVDREGDGDGQLSVSNNKPTTKKRDKMSYFWKIKKTRDSDIDYRKTAAVRGDALDTDSYIELLARKIFKYENQSLSKEEQQELFNTNFEEFKERAKSYIDIAKSLDPTAASGDYAYTEWILNNAFPSTRYGAATATINLDDSTSTQEVKDVLERTLAIINKQGIWQGNNDLIQYTFQEVKDILEKSEEFYNNQLLESEEVSTRQKTIYAEETGIEELTDIDDVGIYKITTVEALLKEGRNTNWPFIGKDAAAKVLEEAPLILAKDEESGETLIFYPTKLCIYDTEGIIVPANHPTPSPALNVLKGYIDFVYEDVVPDCLDYLNKLNPRYDVVIKEGEYEVRTKYNVDGLILDSQDTTWCTGKEPTSTELYVSRGIYVIKKGEETIAGYTPAFGEIRDKYNNFIHKRTPETEIIYTFVEKLGGTLEDLSDEDHAVVKGVKKNDPQAIAAAINQGGNIKVKLTRSFMPSDYQLLAIVAIPENKVNAVKYILEQTELKDLVSRDNVMRNFIQATLGYGSVDCFKYLFSICSAELQQEFIASFRQLILTFHNFVTYSGNPNTLDYISDTFNINLTFTTTDMLQAIKAWQWPLIKFYIKHGTAVTEECLQAAKDSKNPTIYLKLKEYT